MVIGKMLKRQRSMLGLSLSEVSERSGVSSSHLGRIERGERFPSAKILRKVAKTLELDEREVFVIADYLSPKDPTEPVAGRVDPCVIAELAKLPVETQHIVIAIIAILKTLAKVGAASTA